MKTVTVHRAKTNLSKLIVQACAGEEIVIARGKKPVVRLVPVTEHKGERKPGSMKGFFSIGPEFFEPLPQDELDAWHQ